MRYGESETIVIPAYVKMARNERGRKKLAEEIMFYRSVNGLRVPEVLGWNPLTLAAVDGRQATADDYTAIISALADFHDSNPHFGDPGEIIRYELYHKIKARYNVAGVPSLNIKSVNGTKIGSYERALEYFRTVKVPSTRMCMIHGDPHFGNIIIDDEGPVFIDPRGRELYGVAEYDLAKVHLSLTGYNELENMDPILDIRNGNLEIPLTVHPLAFKASRLTLLLLAAIWLGNAPGFTGTRKILSHYYALFMFERVKHLV